MKKLTSQERFFDLNATRGNLTAISQKVKGSLVNLVGEQVRASMLYCFLVPVSGIARWLEPESQVNYRFCQPLTEVLS